MPHLYLLCPQLINEAKTKIPIQKKDILGISIHPLEFRHVLVSGDCVERLYLEWIELINLTIMFFY